MASQKLENLRIILLAALLLSPVCGVRAEDPIPVESFLEQQPLKATDVRRHLFRPYSAVKLDYLGGNYCENLLDKRLNITSYTHQGFDSNSSDAWHLQFPDDTARLVEAFAWEDQYSGIARLESVRRMMIGLLAAHIPGTQAYHFFRHRSGGKTYLIFDDSAGAREGRFLLSTWGDDIQGAVSVGFRALEGGAWSEQKDFTYSDLPEKAGTPAVARSPQSWNESPYTFARTFTHAAQTVCFSGKYGLSDENQPLEFAYESEGADSLAITIGEPGKPMPLLWDPKTPGLIDFGDRKTRWDSGQDGDQTLKAPACNYLVLHKRATWACPGYSSALLVMWEGRPESVEAVAENGYGQVRVVYAKKEGIAKGKVWLYPFHWLNDDDMEYVYRNSESFLAEGHLLHNGFPSQQMVNAIPSGLAAGAVMLTKYHDPFARTAQIEAVNAADAYLEPENKGQTFARSFLEVKTAAWMTQLGKLMNDAEMTEKYAAWVKRTADRLLSPESGYDGKAWPDGWTHFNCMKAIWLAYEATDTPTYREAYERAMEVYTIDKKGLYRNGEPLKAPGGFEVYAGALPMAVWGHDGLKDRVNDLIQLAIPNGWHNPEIPVADLWIDAGAGPWSQDDANPDMLGFMLRGYKLPATPKYLLPTGAFPALTESGEFAATWHPILENPFFLSGPHKIKTPEQECKQTKTEKKVIQIAVSSQKNVPPLIEQCIDLATASGAALDIQIGEGAYCVEVSPDGQHWIPRLDTWCDRPTTRSLDLSFLTGSSEELVRTLEIVPPEDALWLQSSIGTSVVRSHCRTVCREGSAVYRLSLPHATQCHLEFLVGNDYRVDLSSDGTDWAESLSPGQVAPAKGEDQKNAAWLRMVDASRFLNPEGTVFFRFRDGGNAVNYGNASAFLRRVAVYAAYRAPAVYLRMKPAPYARTQNFTADTVQLRVW